MLRHLCVALLFRQQCRRGEHFPEWNTKIRADRLAFDSPQIRGGDHKVVFLFSLVIDRQLASRCLFCEMLARDFLERRAAKRLLMINTNFQGFPPPCSQSCDASLIVTHRAYPSRSALILALAVNVKIGVPPPIVYVASQ